MTRIIKSIIALGALGLGASYLAPAASIMAPGTMVTGTTAGPSMLATSFEANASNTILSNNSGNLVVQFFDPNPGNAGAADADFFFYWDALRDGFTSFDTAVYTYVQIDLLSVSPGLVGPWQLYFTDGDSQFGGPSSSGQTIGFPPISTSGPSSFVIDLTDGGTNNSGPLGWGGGSMRAFRLDPFQDEASFGGSMTISAITFGSSTVPEPSVMAMSLAALAFFGRRRRKSVSSPQPQTRSRS